MDMESAKKVPLNRITHSVRASQAVLQYGVGAMIDFPNQTLMTAAPEYWQEQVVQIHDERLEKVLRVDYFGLPGGQDDPHCREGISYARFPEWYFCPKCRRFQPISDWVSDYKKSATQKRLNSDPEMSGIFIYTASGDSEGTMGGLVRQGYLVLRSKHISLLKMIEGLQDFKISVSSNSRYSNERV